MSKGPLISRKGDDKLFMCIGLRYVEMAPNSSYLVAIAIRGKT
jgi:hypothetical protein